MSTPDTPTRFETVSVLSQDVEDMLYQVTTVLELSGQSFPTAVRTLSEALLSPLVQAALHAHLHRVNARYPSPALQRHRLIRDAAQRSPQHTRTTNQHATTPDNLVWSTNRNHQHRHG